MAKPPEGPVNGGGVPSENVGLGSKRQRRPSVRLGDIGDQPATLAYERRTKQWSDSSVSYHHHHHHRHKDTASKSSKTRPLTNLGNGDNNDSHETLEIDDNNKTASGDANSDLVPIRKAKRGGGGATKKVRSNWAPKLDQETAVCDDDKFSGENEEGFREFDHDEASQSPLKQHSPVHSHENPDRGHGINKEGLFLGKRKPGRSRGVELEGPSDTDPETNEGAEARTFWTLEDGVRMWLNGLGLPQYAPIFEIHEVDEEVLPQLTLEDLKDMGINAVGSRRKLYSAIQKLAKGFS